ncbi:uncharacterized protein LACBIDRAFT_293807 [Laccaria bicolor S238N-H82]|uniref:Predicted protein n=1 Tax=Laccaria bicolor (strain S238N-H82 / ATCC MYA-4686) TaxID=486041 RepID=B0D6T1_LACBS|nr:uncharacterized protein LACBIDRAFT_293807 [Laccaria bicolor S238N-H82]EDR09530.1 predicted protein [Laccaria bicolor S238N-H82]|eukprot:XP_001879879.1 predicted protein [Laccaria bicolor S238N-H82]
MIVFANCPESRDAQPSSHINSSHHGQMSRSKPGSSSLNGSGGIEPLGLAICTLYSSLSGDQAPVEDSARLALRGTSGPGVSEIDPVGLVVDVSDAEKRSKVSSVEVKDLVAWPSTRLYVYYRVYDEGGEISSKTSFDDTDSSLGRLDTLCISPPYTALSLKYCITKAEGVSPDRVCDLFEDEGGDSTLKDGDTVALLSDSYPGVSKEEPLAIVYGVQKDATNPSEQLEFAEYGTWENIDAYQIGLNAFLKKPCKSFVHVKE